MEDIHKLIQGVLKELRQKGYTEKGIKKHNRTYSLLMAYAEQIGQSEYTEELGQAFVSERYGASFHTRRGNNSEYVTEKIRHLEKLWHFKMYGTIHFSSRSGKKKPFQCPVAFVREYELFLAYCKDRAYTNQSFRSFVYPVKNFLTFLEANNITSIDAITAQTVNTFVSMYIDCSKVYLKSLTQKLGTFFRFLHEYHLVSHELSSFLPPIRYVRDAYIPSSWSKEDVIKLMRSVDRGNPPLANAIMLCCS